MQWPTVEELLVKMKIARERETTISAGALAPSPAHPTPPQDSEVDPSGQESGVPREVNGDRIRPWSSVGVRREIERRGWAVIYSRTLREPVLWLKGSNVVVPERWRKYVGYTVDELKALAGVTEEGLRVIHQAKRIMGGTVLPPEETMRLVSARWKLPGSEGQECDKRART